MSKAGCQEFLSNQWRDNGTDNGTDPAERYVETYGW